MVAQLMKDACPECQSQRVYRCKQPVQAGGGFSQPLLPGLSKRWFSVAQMIPVVCGDCGYVRFFAQSEALDALDSSPQWERIRNP